MECYLIVEVRWTDGSITDESNDKRTNYIVSGDSSLLSLDGNLVTVNTSCDISTKFGSQNTNCYGTASITVNFTGYDGLEGYSDDIEFEVVIFESLKVTAVPYPYFD